MYDQLNNIISTHLSLTPDDFNLIQSSFRYKTVEKGVSVLEIGQRAEEVFFINSGYLRYYKVLESGEEMFR